VHASLDVRGCEGLLLLGLRHHRAIGLVRSHFEQSQRLLLVIVVVVKVYLHTALGRQRRLAVVVKFGVVVKVIVGRVFIWLSRLFAFGRQGRDLAIDRWWSWCFVIWLSTLFGFGRQGGNLVAITVRVDLWFIIWLSRLFAFGRQGGNLVAIVVRVDLGFIIWLSRLFAFGRQGRHFAIDRWWSWCFVIWLSRLFAFGRQGGNLVAVVVRVDLWFIIRLSRLLAFELGSQQCGNLTTKLTAIFGVLHIPHFDADGLNHASSCGITGVMRVHLVLGLEQGHLVIEDGPTLLGVACIAWLRSAHTGERKEARDDINGTHHDRESL
jgi:hypothetical protein